MKSIKQDVVKNINARKKEIIFLDIVIIIVFTGIAFYFMCISLSNWETHYGFFFGIVVVWLFFMTLLIGLSIHEIKCLNGELEDIKRRVNNNMKKTITLLKTILHYDTSF